MNWYERRALAVANADATQGYDSPPSLPGERNIGRVLMTKRRVDAHVFQAGFYPNPRPPVLERHIEVGQKRRTRDLPK